MPRAAFAAIILVVGTAIVAPNVDGGCASHYNRAAATAAKPAPSPLAEHDLLGWVRVRSTAPLSRVAAGALGKRASLDQALVVAAGVPAEGKAATDFDRPIVIGILDPQKFGGSQAQSDSRPLVAWIPLRDEAAFRRAVSPTAAVQKGPLRVPGGQSWIDVRGKVAIIAPEATLLGAARATLEPIAAHPGDDDLVIHVGLRNIMDAYGDRAEQAILELAELTRSSNGDESTSFAMRSVRRLATFATSADAVDVSARVQPDGLAITARMSAQKGGSWARYIAQQPPGTGWGTDLLPPDSVLVYTTHLSPEGRNGEVEDSLVYFGSLSDHAKVAGGKKHDVAPAQRAALEKAMGSLSGELAYAVWPAPGGGVGMGGAYKVKDADEARSATRGLQTVLKAEAAQLAADELELPAGTTRVRTQQAALKIDGVPVDLAELSVKWPKKRKSERRAFEWMFGPKLVLATAAVGDRVVFALGRDARERVAAMIRVSHGQAAPSIRESPGFEQALRFHGAQRVSLAYLPLGRMSEFIERLVHATTPDGSETQADLLPLTASPTSAIVSTTNVSNDAYEVTTFLPNAVLKDLGSTGGAMWRIGFQPVLNPPQVPPLPVPPAQLTPPAQTMSAPDHQNSPALPPEDTTPGRPINLKKSILHRI